MSEIKKKHLSYSGYSTYVTCAKKYDLHYNEKLRPIKQPFHLLFGSATDKALNSILEFRKEESAPTEFFANFEKNTALSFAIIELFKIQRGNVTFEEKDFDEEIMTELTSEVLTKKLAHVGWKGENIGALASSLFSSISMGETLSNRQIKALRYLIIFSSIEKIALIIDAFNNYVTPQIEEIISVQDHVKRGILDFKAKLKGVEGIVVCDNKTAGRDYEQDAVLNSVQLAGYGAEVGAYIVFNKTVRKNRTKKCISCEKNGTGQRHKTCDAVLKDGTRCNGEWLETVTPEIIPQIIIDKVPEHNRVMVEEAYSKAEELIATGIFPRNLTGCGKQYGAPCSYINLCWKNDPTGLKKVK
jgi:hypothetical protein